MVWLTGGAGNKPTIGDLMKDSEKNSQSIPGSEHHAG